MTRISTILLIFFTLAVTPSLHAQTDSAPPYLYYYSQLLGGLIIERADGTDSRQIAADVIPPNMSGLSGPGWSPSGKYFAAYGDIYLGYETYRKQPYIVDLNGKNLISWLGLIGTTSIMQWSPTGEDILLIVGSHTINRDINFGTFFWLIDVEQGKLLADFGANFSYLTSDLSKISWDTAHQQIVFFLAPESDYAENRKYYQVTMHFDGTTLREPVSSESFIPLEQSVNLDKNDFIYTGNKTSPSGAYQVDGSFIATLTDTRTKKTLELPLNTQGTACHDYLWNENEQLIITFAGTIIAGGGCGGAVLGLTDSQAKLWRELGGCVFLEPACAGWLPKNISVDSLPLGEAKPVQLDPLTIEYDMVQGVYSIDPTKVRPLTFRCIDYQTADIHDSQTYQLAYNLSGMPCPYDFQASGADRMNIPIVAAVDTVHHLLATYMERYSGVMIWKLNGRQYEPLLKLNTQGYILEFTDHNERLRARNFNGWKIYSVADILAAAATPK